MTSRRQTRGAALVVALALLVIMTLLASSSMRMSIAELMMAGNEQFRHAASMAASTGVETAIASIARHRGHAVASVEHLTGASYEADIRFAGEEATLPGLSVGRFVGQHYEVTSVGTSSRLARDEQVQGVMVIGVVAEGVTTYRQLGTGLEATP